MGSWTDFKSESEAVRPASLSHVLLAFLYLVVLAALLSLAARRSPGHLTVFGNVAAGITVLVAIGYGIQHHRPTHIGPWLLLAGMVGLWLLRIIDAGQIDSALHLGLVFATDMLALTFFAVVIRQRNLTRNPLLWLDIAIITLSCSMLMLRQVTVDQWQLLDSDAFGHMRIFALPLCHILILGGFMGVALTMRGFTPALWLVLLALAILMGMEILRLDVGISLNSLAGLSGVAWSTVAWGALGLLGIAALLPDMQRLSQGSTFRYEPWGRAQVALILAVIVLALVALAGAPSPLQQHPETWVMIIAAIAMQGVLLARCHVAIRSMHSARAALLRSVEQDSLTGLPNQNALRKKLALQATSTRRYAIALVDLNRFHQINYSWGYATGDQVLLAMAQRLQAELPHRVRLYRLQGDVFALLLPVRAAVQGQILLQLARGILDRMHVPVLVDGQRFYLAANIGISQNAEIAQVVHDTLLRDADTALLQAKRQGGNTLALFTPAMHEDIEARHRIASALRQGMGREFRLVFQPIIALEDGRVRSHETLLRWHSASLGEVSPAVFIPIAEEAGLIGEITQWVLREAFAQLTRMPVEQRLSVNISACDLRDPEFLPLLDRLSSEFATDPARLVLEFTEGTLVQDFEQIALPLRARGYQIALDDFGTGYSSLSYLMTLAANSVKLDISFIAEIEHDLDQRALCAALITLCRENGMQVVAEGVETRAQYELLLAMNCELAQGWLFGRPGAHPCAAVKIPTDVAA